MAAEFESGFFYRRPAWHELGTVVDEEVLPENVLEVAGLDWTVSKRPYYFKNGDKEIKSANYGIIRDSDNTELGICKEQYQIIQNSEIAEWTKPLIETGYWRYESGGSLRGGKDPWLLLHQGDREVVDGDKLKNYLLVYWSHNGTRSVQIMPTSIRVVCANTLRAALRQDGLNGEFIIHNSKAHMKLSEAQQLYLKASKAFDDQEELFNRMMEVNMTPEVIKEISEQLTDVYMKWDNMAIDEPSKRRLNRRNKLHNFFNNMGTVSSGTHELGIENTLYNTYNGITEGIEHYLGGRRVKDAGNNVLFGAGAKLISSLDNIVAQYVA